MLEIPVHCGACEHTPTVGVFKIELQPLGCADVGCIGRVVIMVGAEARLEHHSRSLGAAAPPELQCLTVAMMIDEVAFVEPDQARRKMRCEWLAILETPGVAVTEIGCGVLDSVGEI